MGTLLLITGLVLSTPPARCPGPLMSTPLQWWERKEIVPVAVELAKRKNLRRFYWILSYHLPRQEACRGKGLKACLPGIEKMWKDIDGFLRKITKGRQSGGWWQTGGNCWVATIMVYSPNLKELHRFVGKELRRGYFPSARRIDTYFKKIVNAHGGPLIDRNWNCW